MVEKWGPAKRTDSVDMSRKPLTMEKPLHNLQEELATTSEGLLSALKEYPESTLVRALQELSPEDIEIIDGAISQNGDAISAFGGFEAYEDEQTVVEIRNNIERLGSADSDEEKRSLGKAIADAIKV